MRNWMLDESRSTHNAEIDEEKEMDHLEGTNF